MAGAGHQEEGAVEGARGAGGQQDGRADRLCAEVIQTSQLVTKPGGLRVRVTTPQECKIQCNMSVCLLIRVALGLGVDWDRVLESSSFLETVLKLPGRP